MLEKLQDIEDCLLGIVGCLLTILMIASFFIYAIATGYACYKGVTSETPAAVEVIDTQGASP